METSRRTFLGAVGAAASAAVANAADSGATPRPASRFYVAAVTPCDAKGKFDDGAYRDMLAYFKERGADGVLVLGTTGEFPSFSVAERKKIAEVALKHKAGMQMLVQVGTPNLPETLDLLAHAGANGADGILLMPPFYFKNPSVPGLARYCSQVLEATKLPVNLYHYPAMSAISISHELLHKLEHYPNLAGIKDSTGNAESYAANVKEFPKLNMMTGTENNLPAALAAGMGAILVSANIFTKQVAAVFAAHRAGRDTTEAFNKLREANQLVRPGGAAGIKFAFSGVGIRETYVRPPQVDLTDQQKAQMREHFAQLKQIV
jgi:dihydrodipicolinate synthase/N-acetylneuraminate lyase